MANQHRTMLQIVSDVQLIGGVPQLSALDLRKWEKIVCSQHSVDCELLPAIFVACQRSMQTGAGLLAAQLLLLVANASVTTLARLAAEEGVPQAYLEIAQTMLGHETGHATHGLQAPLVRGITMNKGVKNG